MFPFQQYCVPNNNADHTLNVVRCVKYYNILKQLHIPEYLLLDTHWNHWVLVISQIPQRKQQEIKEMYYILYHNWQSHLYNIIYTIVLLFNTIVYQNKYTIELEPYYRLLVFVLVYHYFGRKLSKLSSKPQYNCKQAFKMALVMCGVVISCLILIITELAISTQQPFVPCKFQYDVVSNLLGGAFTILLVVFYYKLQSKMDTKIQPIYMDHPMLQMKTFQDNEAQREDLRILVIMYSASQFLSVFQVIYFLVKSLNWTQEFDNCIPCQMIPCLNMGAESTLGLELFLRFIFHILIFFLPYVALIQFFWVGSINKEERRDSFTNDQDMLNNFFKKMGYTNDNANSPKTYSNGILSDISEKNEKSSFIDKQ